MNNMYEILSENLVRLRKSKGLTQAELADILKYSDKSVSKWETGEALPSLETLVALSEFYELSVDDLLKKPVNFANIEKEEKMMKTNKAAMCSLTVASVFLVATTIFVLGLMKTPQQSRGWMSFVWSVPISILIVAVYTNFIFKKRKYNYFLASIFIWTFIASLFLQLLQSRIYYMLFFIGVPLQVIVILAYGLRREVVIGAIKKQEEFRKKISKKKTEENEKEKTG